MIVAAKPAAKAPCTAPAISTKEAIFQCLYLYLGKVYVVKVYVADVLDVHPHGSGLAICLGLGD